MIMNFHFLTLLLILPVIGAFFVYLVRNNSQLAEENMTFVAFWCSVITFLVSVIVFAKYDPTQAGFQLVENYVWLKDLDVGYRLGVDGISMLLILLTTAIMPICIISSKGVIKHKTKEFLVSFLLLESFIIGSFAALDLVLFYIFFEIMLIPMFLIIGIWGGKDRVYAAYKFFLYTFFGSILFLIAIIVIVSKAGTADITILHRELANLFSFEAQKYLWLAFFIAFAVKIPMWPVHTWLPDAHVQAPTTGSVVLAAILLKMGAYGFIRFAIPLFPEASFYFKDMVIILSILAIIIASLCAFWQQDIKKIIAYSSVAHMGYVTLGIFSFNALGFAGAIFQMLSHGIISAALFLSIGVIYERLHTRNIKDLQGITAAMPNFAILFLIFTFGSVALPATSGFVGEFLTLLAVYKVAPAYSIFAAFGVIIGAVYMLWLTKKVMFGEIVSEKISALNDLSSKELIILIPFAIAIILFGIYPALIFDVINENILDILANLDLGITYDK